MASIKSDHYFLTITYKNSVGVKPKHQFESTIPDLYRRIKRVSKDFSIYPEMTINGRIHYHIILSIDDKIKWHKSVLPILKYQGFVDISKIKDYIKTKEYCEKDVIMMKELLNVELPLTFDKTHFIKDLKETMLKKMDQSILNYISIVK